MTKIKKTFKTATKAEQDLMHKEYAEALKKGKTEFVSSVTGEKLAVVQKGNEANPYLLGNKNDTLTYDKPIGGKSTGNPINRDTVKSSSKTQERKSPKVNRLSLDVIRSTEEIVAPLYKQGKTAVKTDTSHIKTRPSNIKDTSLKSTAAITSDVFKQGNYNPNLPLDKKIGENGIVETGGMGIRDSVKEKTVSKPKPSAIPTKKVDHDLPNDVVTLQNQIKSNTRYDKSYAVVSKENNKEYIFDRNHKLVGELDVLLGKKKGDQKNNMTAKNNWTSDSPTTPAGKYAITNKYKDPKAVDGDERDYIKNRFDLDYYTPNNEKVNTNIAQHQTYSKNRMKLYDSDDENDKRVSLGCINCSKESFMKAYENLNKGDTIYVAPEPKQKTQMASNKKQSKLVYAPDVFADGGQVGSQIGGLIGTGAGLVIPGAQPFIPLLSSAGSYAGNLIGQQFNEEEQINPYQRLAGRYEDGGMVGSRTVEIEDNEYIETPDGSAGLAQGNTHEADGITVNLPNGSFVYPTDMKEEVEAANGNVFKLAQLKDKVLKGQERESIKREFASGGYTYPQWNNQWTEHEVPAYDQSMFGVGRNQNMMRTEPYIQQPVTQPTYNPANMYGGYREPMQNITVQNQVANAQAPLAQELNGMPARVDGTNFYNKPLVLPSNQSNIQQPLDNYEPPVSNVTTAQQYDKIISNPNAVPEIPLNMTSSNMPNMSGAITGAITGGNPPSGTDISGIFRAAQLAPTIYNTIKAFSPVEKTDTKKASYNPSNDMKNLDYNIEPALQANNRALNTANRNIDQNVTSRAVANSLKQNTLGQGIAASNQLYGQKENIENQYMQQGLMLEDNINRFNIGEEKYAEQANAQNKEIRNAFGAAAAMGASKFGTSVIKENQSKAMNDMIIETMKEIYPDLKHENNDTILEYARKLNTNKIKI